MIFLKVLNLNCFGQIETSNVSFQCFWISEIFFSSLNWIYLNKPFLRIFCSWLEKNYLLWCKYAFFYEKNNFALFFTQIEISNVRFSLFPYFRYLFFICDSYPLEEFFDAFFAGNQKKIYLLWSEHAFFKEMSFSFLTQNSAFKGYFLKNFRTLETFVSNVILTFFKNFSSNIIWL